MLKQCISCLEWKSLTEFHNDKHKKDGLCTACKECKNKYAKEYRKNNKEKAYQSVKRSESKKAEYYKKHKSNYHFKRKELHNKISKDYYYANKERLLKLNKITSKEWFSNNKEHARMLCNRRRGRIRNLPHNLNIERWNQIQDAFGWKCAYCGKEDKLEQEHFIALSNGGEYTSNNIIPSCRICNSSKSNKDFFEWYPKYKHYSKTREYKILKHLNYYKDKSQQLALTI